MKKCRKQIAKESYNKNKESVVKKVIERNKLNTIAFQNFKETLVCVICGEDESVCLDFHHLDPTQKEFDISQRTHYSIHLLQKELEKCICVCANCHRKIHKYGLEETKALISSNLIKASNKINNAN